MKLKRIAEALGARLEGDGDVEILGVAGIEEAGPHQLTFVSNPKYRSKIQTTRAGAVLLSPEAPKGATPVLICDDPYHAFARAIELFYEPPRPIPGVHPTAVVSEAAEIGPDCSLGPHVSVAEGAKIGARAVLHAGVTIYPHAQIGDDFLAHSHASVREYCRIGDRVILQNGAVVGSDGFGFAPLPDGSYYKIVQSGIVVLEDDVEVGACSCIDRATVGETRIGRGSKIDNLVQIGHGCRVGQNTVVAAQAGLAGSSRVGDRVMLGGQVGVAGHLSIGDAVQATPQTGIARSVEAGRHVSGSPEMDSPVWKKNYLLMLKFPEMAQTVRRLERTVRRLEERLSRSGSDETE